MGGKTPALKGELLVMKEPEFRTLEAKAALRRDVGTFGASGMVLATASTPRPRMARSGSTTHRQGARNQRKHMNNNLLSPGRIAKICNVAPRTVCKWIDRGILKGYRMPGGLHRRVTLADFKAFRGVEPESERIKVAPGA